MVKEAFDAGLEFVVLEGGGQENRYPLSSRNITLGRKDAAFASGPGRISFADPTVSGHHCSLEWDPRKNRYQLTHFSKTNHTLVNGKVVTSPQHIHVGDKIKMGSLVIQLRLYPVPEVKAAPIAPAAAPVIPPPLPPLPPSLSSATMPVAQALAEAAAASKSPPPAKISLPSMPAKEAPASGYQLLVLNGEDAATLFPLTKEIQVVQEPGGPTDEPAIEIQGCKSTRAALLLKPPGIHVTAAATGDRPILIDNPLPGVVRQRSPGPEFGNLLTPDSILVANTVAMVLVTNEQSALLRQRLLAGEPVSPLQTGLFREGDRVWNRGEQHVLRFLAGPLKGLALWLDPRHYSEPITIGRLGQKNLVELTDRGAAQVKFLYRGESFHLQNCDAEARVPVNSTELAPGEDVALACGDRVRLGRTLVRYEYLPIQARIDTYSVMVLGKEMPLQRETNLVGSGPQADIRVEDPRVGADHGRIVVGEGSLRYLHRQAGTTAIVNSQELNAGQEAALRVGTMIRLCAGVEVQVCRRSAALAGAAGVPSGQTSPD